MSHQINNKRIAKNTLFMYIRMFVILVVTLYTARVVIRTLGIDDYGIYNIVGGVVVLFSFVNISLRSAFQRFISYELGKEDIQNSNKIIGSSFTIVLIFSFIFLILAETIGLWFVYYKLVIPTDKMTAALWVYQFSILTFILNLFQTPYQAIIISYERMSFYAGYSIVESALKLIVAFLLVMASSNQLIIYAGLGFCVAIISTVITAVYCHKKLEIPVRSKGTRQQLVSLFHYSSWSMANSSTVIVAQQGGNIILNLFVGVIANGAYGIANQVTAAINGFVSNFQSAFNPQITKSYSARGYQDLFKLINRTSLLSFCLLAVISVPFFIECDYILTLWLGECPEYAVGFCNLMLVYFLIDSCQAPLWMLIYATGKIKVYQIWSGIITLLNIPIAALLLYLGFSAYWVFIVRLTLNAIIAIIRPFYTHKLVNDFSVLNYSKEALLPILKVVLICCTIVIMGILAREWISSLLIICLSILFSIVLIPIFGIKKNDRNLIVVLIRNKIRR